MVVSPDFLLAINQLAELSDIVFSQGDAGVHFELMARPSRDVARVQLTLDEQNLTTSIRRKAGRVLPGRETHIIRA
jgi:type VI secretion system protein ImpL